MAYRQCLKPSQSRCLCRVLRGCFRACSLSLVSQCTLQDWHRPSAPYAAHVHFHCRMVVAERDGCRAHVDLLAMFAAPFKLPDRCCKVPWSISLGTIAAYWPMVLTAHPVPPSATCSRILESAGVIRKRMSLGSDVVRCRWAATYKLGKSDNRHGCYGRIWCAFRCASLGGGGILLCFC